MLGSVVFNPNPLDNAGRKRLPGVPIRTPEEETKDRELIEAYFSDKTRNEPTPEEITAICNEYKNDPKWIESYYADLDRKNRVYTPQTYRLNQDR